MVHEPMPFHATNGLNEKNTSTDYFIHPEYLDNAELNSHLDLRPRRRDGTSFDFY